MGVFTIGYFYGYFIIGYFYSYFYDWVFFISVNPSKPSDPWTSFLTIFFGGFLELFSLSVTLMPKNKG